MPSDVKHNPAIEACDCESGVFWRGVAEDIAVAQGWSRTDWRKLAQTAEGVIPTTHAHPKEPHIYPLPSWLGPPH